MSTTHTPPQRNGPILFVTSAGGHLAQLLALREWWGDRPRVWVHPGSPDAASTLNGEDSVVGYFPTTRNVVNLLRNTLLAIRTVRRVRPSLVVSTGAGIAVPFFWVAKLLGVRTIYLEVLDRIDSATLSGTLCYPVADAFLVQWEPQLSFYPDATVVGPVL